MVIKELNNRVIEVSKKYKLSHISSCLSLLPILRHLYSICSTNDMVVLDNAHAHIAHLVVKEDEAARGYELGMGAKFDIDELIKKNGIHCDRSVGCDASGGSLGHGIGISIGLSLADRTRKVFCTVSDGSMMEGSNWEALRILNELQLPVEVHANLNGYSAVAEVNRVQLGSRLKAFYPKINLHHTSNTPEFDGVEGHYKVL